MISPALLWDNELILKQEKEFSLKHESLDAVVYTTVGSLEGPFMVDPWKRLVASIKEHNYKGLQLKDEIAEGETHYTIIPFIVTHGLKSVFAE